MSTYTFTKTIPTHWSTFKETENSSSETEIRVIDKDVFPSRKEEEFFIGKFFKRTASVINKETGDNFQINILPSVLEKDFDDCYNANTQSSFPKVFCVIQISQKTMSTISRATYCSFGHLIDYRNHAMVDALFDKIVDIFSEKIIDVSVGDVISIDIEG